MRAPSAKSMVVIKEMNTVVINKGLLDGGATHALRKCKDLEEWEAATPTEVILAEGTTSKMRLKEGTLTLITQENIQPIVPMGVLTMMGYEVEWKQGHCRVRRRGKSLEVEMVDSCPMVEVEIALGLIEEMELMEENHMLRLAAMKMPMEQLKDRPELAMTKALKEFFPGVPDEIVSRVMPSMEVDGDELPWNRRRRRTFERAEHLVIHLFAGANEKEWMDGLEGQGVAVLCVDTAIDPGQDLHRPQVFAYLLKLARTGKVKAILGGPPCRTVSACRTRSPGPRPVRSVEEPYGKKGLNQYEKELVDGDAVLWLRMLTLHVVAQASTEDKVLFVKEQPRDPGEYRDDGNPDYVSVWRFQEWKTFEQKYGMHLVRCDQGALGHRRRKPTTIGVNAPYLDHLDGLGGPGTGEEEWTGSLEERIQQTKSWACWAPGLKTEIMKAVRMHLKMQPQLKPVRVDELQRWKTHFLNDHMPARRDCKTCVQAQGRGRPHVRVTHPDAYTLAVDLSGKLKEGVDQRGKVAYFLVGVYTYPVDMKGRSLVREEEEHPLPAEDDLLPEADEEMEPLEVREDEEAVAEERESEKDVGDLEKWKKMVQEAASFKVKNLVFAEPVLDRKAMNVLTAIARIYARLRALGLPVLRLHSDRARELVSAPIRKFAEDRGIYKTTVPGDSYKENGRAEQVVGALKRATRTILCASKEKVEVWPLALRQAAERMLRGQLRSLGYPAKQLLPFASVAYVKKKAWTDRYQDWRWDREKVTVMGPDAAMSLTSGGYWVRSCEDGRFFSTTDAIPEPEEINMEVEEALSREQGAVNLEVRPEVDLLAPKRRRLNGKQKLSTMRVEGEDVEEKMLDHHSNIATWVAEGMELLDGVGEGQEWWLPVVREGVQEKNELEMKLRQMKTEDVDRLEEEWRVTKTVGMQEVRTELQHWIEPAKKEYIAMTEELKAVRPVSRKEVNDLPGMVEFLPSKAVCTRKAPDGRRKVRGVVCGNFASSTAQEDTYASGADATQIRSLAKMAAMRGWSLAGTDIRTAFLHAPRRDDSKTVVMEVPAIFRECGLANKEEVWIIDKAVYGLTTSPKDWGVHRDGMFKKMMWKWKDEEDVEWDMKFEVTEEPNLWKIIGCHVEGVDLTGRHMGFMSIYVDDVLIAAKQEVIKAAVKRIEQEWPLSDIEWPSEEEPLRYCGFEMWKSEEGFDLRQSAYAKELVEKWGVREKMEVPMYKAPEEEEELDPTMLRRAQAITGGLLWLATKTRPDLMAGVATMARNMKSPKQVVDVGMALLRYVNATTDVGLKYAKATGWGARDHLSVKRHDKLLEVFSDISYGTAGDHKSVQGILVYFAGSPIAWEATKQPFVAQSTAEAELIGYCESLVAGRATAVLLEVILGEQLTQKRIYGDNVAAIALASNGSGSWRTRHLRIRAASLRWALEDGGWSLTHLSGKQLVADGMTKSLNGQAFERFREDLGMPVVKKMMRKAILAKEDQAVTADGFGMKVRLLAVIGADLVGKASAMKGIMPVDELDVLLVVGVILMAIGAVWVAKQTAGVAVGCVRRLRGVQPLEVVKVKEKPRDLVKVDRGIQELHDQWGRTWVVRKYDGGGFEQEHHWNETAASSASSSSTSRVKACSNSWNEFQHINKGKGWGSEKMRAEYYKAKGYEKKKY